MVSQLSPGRRVNISTCTLIAHMHEVGECSLGVGDRTILLVKLQGAISAKCSSISLWNDAYMLEESIIPSIVLNQRRHTELDNIAEQQHLFLILHNNPPEFCFDNK
jgi:hypothetical protein